MREVGASGSIVLIYPRMIPIGLLISWATPDASSPIAAIRSRISKSCSRAASSSAILSNACASISISPLPIPPTRWRKLPLPNCLAARVSEPSGWRTACCSLTV